MSQQGIGINCYIVINPTSPLRQGKKAKNGMELMKK